MLGISISQNFTLINIIYHIKIAYNGDFVADVGVSHQYLGVIMVFGQR